jgi:putative DNA primase/helicase
MNGRLDLDALKGALEARAVDLARSLLGEPNRGLSNKRELRFGRKGSLVLSLAGKHAYRWQSHELGVGGSLLDLISFAHGCDFRGALDWAAAFVGGAALPVTVRRPKKSVAEDDDSSRLRIAQWLWRQAQPIAGTPAEIYLRRRGISMPLPRTLRYLSARDEHAHSLVAAFGFADEIEPGILDLSRDQIWGIHLIHLAPDGTDRLRDDVECKITIGRCPGIAIVVAPGSDSTNNLLIAEGIENAMTGAQATGFTAWASASASRLVPLADVVPAWIECVTIVADDDDAGRKKSNELAHRMSRYGFEVRIVPPFFDGDAP